MNGDDDEMKDGDVNDEMTLTADDGGPRLTWLPSASVGNDYSEDCDGGSNDDGADHSFLLLVRVAGRDGPALTFAALRLHIHLQLIVILMISWFSWWYVAILIIFLTMMRHFLDYLFNDDTSLSWLSFWRWCNTHHRLLGNSCVPHFHISLPAAAHLPQNIFSKLGRIASDMVKS